MIRIGKKQVTRFERMPWHEIGGDGWVGGWVLTDEVGKIGEQLGSSPLARWSPTGLLFLLFEASCDDEQIPAYTCLHQEWTTAPPPPPECTGVHRPMACTSGVHQCGGHRPLLTPPVG